MSVIHARVHSEYSLKDSLLRVGDIVNAARERQMSAVALTDHMNLFAAVKFYKAALNKKVKPIIGADVELGDHGLLGTLYCTHEKGYQHLCGLLSRAYEYADVQGSPKIALDDLWEHQNGLIFLLHQEQKQFASWSESQNERGLVEYFQQFSHRMVSLVEVQQLGKPLSDKAFARQLQWAKSLNWPVMATQDVRFLDSEDYFAHRARVAIANGLILGSAEEGMEYVSSQYFCSASHMQSLFKALPQALESTETLAVHCNVELTLGEVSLPSFPTPEGESLNNFLASQAQKGLSKRLSSAPHAEEQSYWERLKLELGVIQQMGFAGYFLIVADFIQWAKHQHIPVGPGRGSGAGSLVAYALEITDLDPLFYDLLFERFLNPERVSMPDFDIDFCMERRDEVIEYVAARYGADKVSQIATFGTMAAKAVVRDVGRVLGHPYGFVDTIAKLIPFEIGMTLEKALAQEALLQERYEQEEEVKSLIDLAKKLEGLVRNVGRHAGGLVIAPSALTNFSALYFERGGRFPLTQLDKDDIEAIGLVKFDFLGLRTLTIIDWALKNIQFTSKKLSTIDTIPLDDKKTFDLLCEGKTVAVFQLESRGMQELILRLKPDCFEDIIALVALYRPGPLQSGMVDDFIARKHGQKSIEYLEPCLETILKPTYGVILYQEQVMQIAQVLAGYTLGAADVLRRAMGKKKPEEMAKQREFFLLGAKNNGISEKNANAIFDLMEKFAGYGFNKSHSAAYALLSYQTAYLKAHFPAEFMAAVLTSEMSHTDKLLSFIQEARKLGIAVLPPDIQHSQSVFTVEDQAIRYGLGAIKGLGESIAVAIVQERSKAPFSDLLDFIGRLRGVKCSKRVYEAMIYAGACDGFPLNRAQLIWQLPRALSILEQLERQAKKGIGDLFAQKSVLPIVPSGLSDEGLTYLQEEKNALGFYFSSHPCAYYRALLGELLDGPLSALSAVSNGRYSVVGLIDDIRLVQTKRGDQMAFLALGDEDTQLDVAVFPQVLLETRRLLSKGNVVWCQLMTSGEEKRFQLETIRPIEKARFEFARQLEIYLNPKDNQENILNLLREKIGSLPNGKIEIRIFYAAKGQWVKFGVPNVVEIQSEDFDALTKIIKHSHLEINYQV